jgi:hypothetical protein
VAEETLLILVMDKMEEPTLEVELVEREVVIALLLNLVVLE